MFSLDVKVAPLFGDVEEEDILSAEVSSAIEVVKDLTEFLKTQPLTKDNFRKERKLTYRDQFTPQLAAARKLGAQGAIPECQNALRLAHGLFWQMLAEEHAVLFPFGAEITAPEIWEAAKDQGKLSTENDERLVAAKWYLFGSMKAGEFVPARFEEAVRLLEELARPPQTKP